MSFQQDAEKLNQSFRLFLSAFIESIFKDWKSFISFIFYGIGLAIMVAIFRTWFNNPEITYMQIFKLSFWHWLIAMTCLVIAALLRGD